MQASPQETAHINPFGEQFRTFQFYPSESHKKVVHRITRGLECNCGLILLTGEIGIGKTSVCRHIMQSFGDKYVFAESGNPFFKPAELLYNFCKQYKVDTTGRHSINDLTEGLHDFFLRQVEAGKKPVIIIDESHLLAEEHFSLLLALYNMRLGAIPLVQIILIGQVEIMNRLKQPGLEALNQRIGVRCELLPMNKDETEKYVQFKLVNANFPNLTVFDKSALTRIWLVTGGLPRLINHISSHALDNITFSGASKISSGLIEKVASDPMYQGLFTIRTKKKQREYKKITALVLASLVAGWSAYIFGLPTLTNTLFRKELVRNDKLVQQKNASANKHSNAANLIQVTQHPEVKNKILAMLPVMPNAPKLLKHVSPVATDSPSPKTLLIPTQRSDVSVTIHDSPQTREPSISDTQEGASVIAQAIESIRSETTPQENSAHFSNEMLDEVSHPALDALQIDAHAWTEEPSTRMVVIGNQVLHEGDQVGSFILKAINRDHLIFSLNGIDYKKNVRL